MNLPWFLNPKILFDPHRIRRASRWNKKQGLAYPGRYYGDGGTIHSTTHLDVTVNDKGKVVAVWYRCQMLPFEQHEAEESDYGVPAEELPEITGIEVLDPWRKKK